jgi:hypothetical protein
MKQLLATVTLILCLSFPAAAGHVQIGGFWCDCNNPESCTTGQLREGTEQTTDEPQNSETYNDAVSELDLILEAFILWLIKA